MSSDPDKKPHRALRWVLLGSAAVLIGIAVWLFVLPYNPGAGPPRFTISKATTWITQPLDARGRPDYIAWLNARYTEDIANEDNGFVAYLATVPIEYRVSDDWHLLLKTLGIDRLPDVPRLKSRTEIVIEQMDNSTDEVWSDALYAELSAFLDANRAALDEFVRVAEFDHWRHPVIVDDGGLLMIHRAFEGSGHSSAAAELLVVRAMRSAARGDGVSAARDLGAVMRLGSHLSRGRDLSSTMYGLLIRSIAAIGYERICKRYELDADGWAALGVSLDAAPPVGEVWRAVDEDERVGALDMIASMADDPGATGDGDWGPNNVKHRFVNFDNVLRRINQRFDSVVAAMRIDDPREPQNAMDRLEIYPVGVGGGSRRNVGDSLMNILVPALIGARRKQDNLAVMITLTRTALRLAEYRARRGAYPVALSEVAAYRGAGPPMDLFSGEPLVYKRVGEGYVLYSVGENFTDDNAAVREVIGTAETEELDIVLRVGGEGE